MFIKEKLFNSFDLVEILVGEGRSVVLELVVVVAYDDSMVDIETDVLVLSSEAFVFERSQY